MKPNTLQTNVDSSEFIKFADFFKKYLNGSSSQNEAFLRASYTYRKLFKKVLYKNCDSFLAEFFRTQHVN